MGIKDILELERENANIILHKEGLFIRAYEYSAYLFTKHLSIFNIIKKYYKNVKQEVVYLGFPQKSFSKIESICKEQNLTIIEENNRIIISGLASFTENEFVNWKKDILLVKSEGVALSPRTHSLKENQIIEKLRNFSVVSKTPIECQQFIVELQQQLNG